jgi:enolase-phosphatase E1
VVLLDVEGTTTPIAFVTDVLFPYARSHLRAFLRQHHGEPAVREALNALRDEGRRENAGGAPLVGETEDSVATYAEWLMDRDSKSSGLKSLQGLIWQVGFGSGELRGEVFADVPPALRRWRAAGVRTAIYSSGSELAQRLLFGWTPYGDLTRELAGHFDTAVGPKRDRDSYARIAERLGEGPCAILFVSDIPAELAAASAAGCQVALAVRPGNSPYEGGDGFATVRSFEEIVAGGS